METTNQINIISTDSTHPTIAAIEALVLGSILNFHNSSAVHDALQQLTTESFFDPRHVLVFAAIEALIDRGDKVDIQTTAVLMFKNGSIERLEGGAAFIANLTVNVGSGGNLQTHVRILLEYQIARSLAKLGRNTMNMANDQHQDISEALEYATSELERIGQIGMVASRQRHISSIVDDCVANARKRHQQLQSGQTIGVTSGLQALDVMTNGFKPAQLIILAARPAMGKTAALLKFVLSAASSGTPVCVYSLEMSDVSLVDRLMLCDCDIEARRYRNGDIHPKEWEQIEAARDRLSKLPICIDDKSHVSMRYIETHSRIMQRKGKCELVCIDYLQLANVSSKGRNREQEISQASAAAKNIAKELAIPVVLLSQLSRDVEKRGGTQEPMLSDLRDSGSIEQDADVVIFIHRQEYYEKKALYTSIRYQGREYTDLPIKGLGKFIIAKNRDGATGSVLFHYNESMTKFSDFLPPTDLSYNAANNRPVSSGSINATPFCTANEVIEDLPF